MIRFLADEDFNGAITRGLVRRNVGVVRVQDVGLRGTPDQRVLEWAAEAERVVLTHDRATLIGTAYALIRAGQPMHGLIASAQTLGIGIAIDDLALISQCTEPHELRDRVLYLPIG